MVVLAFLTDPSVVGKILEHLGLSTSPPPIAPARPSPGPFDPPFLVQELASYAHPALDGFVVEEGVGGADGQGGAGQAPTTASPTIRPPPRTSLERSGIRQ